VYALGCIVLLLDVGIGEYGLKPYKTVVTMITVILS